MSRIIIHYNSPHTDNALVCTGVPRWAFEKRSVTKSRLRWSKLLSRVTCKACIKGNTELEQSILQSAEIELATAALQVRKLQVLIAEKRSRVQDLYNRRKCLIRRRLRHKEVEVHDTP